MIAKPDFPSVNQGRKGDGVSATGEAYKVLVVDDSMFVSKQITQILSSEGFSVVAPTKMTVPSSTKGRKLSCCDLLKR